MWVPSGDTLYFSLLDKEYFIMQRNAKEITFSTSKRHRMNTVYNTFMLHIDLQNKIGHWFDAFKPIPSNYGTMYRFYCNTEADTEKAVYRMEKFLNMKFKHYDLQKCLL